MSQLPFPANVAAIAGALATITSIFSGLPKFESGGIVGGSSYYGDKILARVNSSELILNRQQQASLYGQLNSQGVVSVGEMRLKNGDIVGALEYSHSKNKAFRG